MDRSKLTLIKNIEVSAPAIPFSQMLDDHNAILQGYLDTHVTRNHSDKTIQGDRRFLRGWFEGFMVVDDNHPDGERQLFLWEAMEPVLGRQRIIEFSKGLIETGLKTRTVNGYLGSLRRLFEYVLEYPYVPGAVVEPIVSKYARIE